MRLIGITGSIACGKSTVSRELLRRGYQVIDGDLLARELTGPGGPAMKEISSVFGHSYMLPDGSLDRRKMGRLVFSDPAARDRLDRVLAPYLQALTLDRIEAARSEGAVLCFLDMPLLYEKGYDRYCNTVWCVWLPEDIQLRRLMARDGYSREEALSRMRAMMSSDEKANISAVVIDNSGTVEDTLRQVSAQLQTEISRAEASPRRRRSTASASDRAFSPQEPPVSPSRHDQSPPVSVPEIIRPDSFRKKPSGRKSAWTVPVWIRVSLISLAVFLALSLTAQILMQAYLTRRTEAHKAEQKAIDSNYPLMYRKLIEDTSAQYNLSPSLIAAVIMNESSFRPDAESAVGARGLMQLMPDTAEWIAHKLRVDDYQPDQLTVPETNVRFGCWYLNYLCSLFDGDPLCVVCAYHAGQGEISSWLSNPLYSSDGQTLNMGSLPDGPTKQYAGRVIRDYGIYQAKYFNQDDLTVSDDSAAVSR